MRRAAIRSVRLCAVAWLLLPAGARAQTVPVLTLPGAGALTARQAVSMTGICQARTFERPQ